MDKSTTIHGYKPSRTYTFDTIFSKHDNNLTVFFRGVKYYNVQISALIESVLNGINATCFTYGMTGSGKTYTILGDFYKTSTGEKGISELAIEFLFSKMQKNHTIKMSYLEIYNEQVKDLLVDHFSPLIIVEDPIKGVTVPGLTEYTIESPKSLLNYIRYGNQKRTMGETSANQFSSRSHAILQICKIGRAHV